MGMPIPSAARSLSRIAMKALPYFVRIRLTANQVIPIRQAKMTKKKPRSPPISHPSREAFGSVIPIVPFVSPSQCSRMYSTMNCPARVAMVR